ncbi:hypothetical protein BJ166DRAFT_511069 [Pestalotiopsis sp. NC0098]|nr:hypothetical protein BJ166DRAFT_511069 [Pestalotiopsis sp. NC0098]
MTETRKYFLSPTPLIPNSPQPLLHYPGFLSREIEQSPNAAAVSCHKLFESNGWTTQWIFRYGPTQRSHYHSTAHECMVVLTGTARIRFGVADTADDLEASTHGVAREGGGVELDARAGDVFVIPAGVAHKTYDTRPETEFALLTPGRGHAIAAEDKCRALAGIELSGFTMMGAYPAGAEDWDHPVGGEHVGRFEEVWRTGKPVKDPVLADSDGGLVGLWT